MVRKKKVWVEQACFFCGDLINVPLYFNGYVWCVNKKSCWVRAVAAGWIINEKKVCFVCGKKMRNVRDNITGKVSPFLWRCKCMPKGVSLSIG